MAGDRRKVLIVDDDVAIRLVMRDALRDAGFAPTTVENGRAALEELCAASAAGESYEAMLLDVVMPEIDGWRVLDAVKANPLWKDMKVIVVSGYRQPARAFMRVMEQDGVFIEKGADFDCILVRVLQRLTAA